MAFQQTIIEGNLGADASFEYTPTGVALCKFSVAVSESWGKGDARQTETTWYRCSVWRERAEAIHSWLHKGSKVMVVGKVKASAYTDKNTGKPSASLELTASQVVFLDSRADNAEPSRNRQSQAGRGGGGSDDDFDPNNIPF